MKKRILIAGKTVGFRMILSAILADKYEVFNTGRLKNVPVTESPFDLIITYPRLEDGDCFDFAKSPVTRGIPIALASDTVDTEILSKAQKANIGDLLKLPVEPLEFDERVEKILFKYAPSYERPDPVTGLHKKTYGEEQIAELLDNGAKGTLMLVEVCKYSFASGKISEEMLTAASDVLKKTKSNKGVLYVAGDGGFMIFEPNLCEKIQIEKYAENLIKALNSDVKTKMLFVSVGLASSIRHGSDFKDLYLMCDMGLGVARQGGKNRACFYKW